MAAAKLLRGVTRALTLAITDRAGEPVSFVGATVKVILRADGSAWRYEPSLTINGNEVSFGWNADNQPYTGGYTIILIADYTSGNVNRVVWHGDTSIVLVDYSYQEGGDTDDVDAGGVFSLAGSWTVNGASAYEIWLGAGHTGDEDAFLAWLRQPATDAASAAEAQMTVIQGRADEDHTRAGNDHTTAGQDHTRAGNDHTTATDDHRIAAADHSTATDDHTLAASDRATAEADHTQAASDHTQASSDHTTAEADHGIAASDHTAAAADHTQAGNDHSRAESDHTTAASDHSQAGTDHTRAEGDHATAGQDHTQAGSDHTTAAGDHTTAAADHTQAVADHAVMAGYDTRLGNVESEVSQLGQEVGEILPAFEVSDNLLDTSTMTQDSRMNAQTGAIVSDESCDLSDYIKVEAGVTYEAQGSDGSTPASVSSRWYFFNASKEYIAWSLITGATATVPSGAEYLRIAFPKISGSTEISDKMVAKGNSVVTYQPYYKRIAEDWIPTDSQYDTTSEKPLQNKVVADTILNGVGYGQQSIPTGALKQTTSGFNKFNPNDPDFIVGRLITATGTTANATGASTGYIAVKPGERYCIYGASQAQHESKPAQSFLSYGRVNAYDSSKNPISGAYSASANWIDVPAGAAYIRIGFSGYTTGYNFMVVKDSNPSLSIDYEPFKFVLDVKNIPLSEQDNDAGFVALVKDTIALPPIKAFAGHPINIYHFNIVDYFKDGYYFKAISKGNLTKEKWSYTPAGAETFNLNLVYLDQSKRELNKETIPVVVVSASQKSSLTVLVIGDSTVNLATSLPGGGETGKMLALASADNYPLTLLGTRGTGANQHEGRGGWTAKMMCTLASSGTTPNAFWNPSTSKFDFAYYMAQQGYSGVDCVFFQFGINDMTSYNGNRIVDDTVAETAITEMLTYMDEMINSIHAYDSNIKVVINTTIPGTDDQDVWLVGNQPWWRYKRNIWMLNVASLTHYANMSNVFLSWFCAAFNIANLEDTVHPNQNGFDELGEQMYSFMRAIN